MVLGYLCPEHGFHHDCDVDEIGERICPVGGDTAVTGITGYTRSRPPGEVVSGDINWRVETRHRVIRVPAFDVEEAVERALELEPDAYVKRVYPARRRRGGPRR